MSYSEAIKPTLIFIRHAESTYAQKSPDLTPKGLQQAAQTGLDIKELVHKFDHHFVRTSPALRAKETAELVLKYTGLADKKLRPRTESDLSNFKILSPDYFKYDREKSTPVYGELYLTDPFLADDNPLIEARKTVTARTHRAFQRYTRLVHTLSQDRNPRCGIIFSHFETNVNLWAGLYTDSTEFPIRDQLPPQNAETLVIECNGGHDYTLKARGIEVRKQYNPQSMTFSSIA
jgi:broad specificity phosphatase PhoE